MSQFYTLKRFFTEAKAIVERLDIPNRSIFKIDVHFVYNEANTGDEFDCFIQLSDKKRWNAEDHIEIFVCNPNPETALRTFENAIIEKFNLSNQLILDPSSENLAIELPDPDKPIPEA